MHHPRGFYKNLCEIILGLGRLENKIEVVRQLLCEFTEFTPYSSFKRLDICEFN